MDLDENEHEEQECGWTGFCRRLGTIVILHPFEYSNVLIQLGHEPIPPRHGISLFGKSIMFLPNIFEYAGHIRRTEGFLGMYRGFTPKLVGSSVGLVCSTILAFNLDLPEEGKLSVDSKWREGSVTEEEYYAQFKKALKRDLILSLSSLVVSHPFHVISVRMMAQFVGKETLYQSVFGSAWDILKNDGISGLFAGLMPKMLWDVACLVLTSSTVYFISKYPVKNKISRTYCAAVGTQFIFTTVLYPLQVISTCMIVSGSKLMAGRPPIMPEYAGWKDCWKDLQARGELTRGSSSFLRYVV